VFEAGLTYPVVRTRLRNLSLTALWFQTNDQGNILNAPFSLDNLRGFRLRAEADWVDSIGGINQLYAVFSRASTAGSTDNGGPLASRAAARRFQQDQATFARLQSLAAAFRFRRRARSIRFSRPCSTRRFAAMAGGCSAAPSTRPR
jgi:hypothetical protein